MFPLVDRVNDVQSDITMRDDSSLDRVGHVCPTCNKCFTKKRNLVRHMNTHSDDDAPNYRCHVCQRAFTHSGDLSKHMDSHAPVKVLECIQCLQKFTRSDNLKRHMKLHLDGGIKCSHCELTFSKKRDVLHHQRIEHGSKKRKIYALTSTSNKRRKIKVKKALDVFSVYTLKPSESVEGDLMLCLDELRPQLLEVLKDQLDECRSIKWYLVADVQFIHNIANDEELTSSYFRTDVVTELREGTLPDNIGVAFSKILKSFEEFIREGSGWILEKMLRMDVFCAKLNPFAASSYIPLPKKLVVKKALLNIRNEDKKCLVWCLLAHKYTISREDHPYRVSHYQNHETEIQLGDIQFPVPVSKISHIEKLNNIRVNVYGYEDEEIFPLHISKREDSQCVNLLLISDENNQHYVLIRNMSRLLGGITKHNGAQYVCYRCLHRYSREDLLQDHTQYCKDHAPQRIKMPSEDQKYIEFTNKQYQHSIPFIIYADFEALIVKEDTCKPSNSRSYTHRLAVHEPCGYAYVIVGPDGKCLKQATVYRGTNSVEHFLMNLIRERQYLGEKLQYIKPLKMTSEDEIEFQRAVYCNLCHRELETDRVRDHNHVTGAYRGALHNACNLNYRQTTNIPVVFHNLKNYDAHHIMLGIGKLKDHKIDVIATNIEKYISFKISKKDDPSVCLQFIDSLQFLNASLEKLVSNLDLDEFHILREHFPNVVQQDAPIRKGVYPYSYMTSFKKFDEDVLPPPFAFHNDLKGEDIKSEDYQHALSVWNTFNIKNLGEYHDLYVKTDVLLLADVFENFRKLCLSHYSIDSAHLITSPGLAWQASLKMTEQSLELLTDENMLLFIERGIRGGICMISQRRSEANNRYLENYDSNKPEKHIIYLDANNLYGWAMSQPLPYGGFEWISIDNLDEFWIMSLKEDAQEGYIFEVDLVYPESLHDYHNEYPLAPERLKIEREMLSPYAERLVQQVHHDHFVSTMKLVPNLHDKEHYIVHYRNLQLYLSLGLRLKKIHKVLKFNQKPWLKRYIEFNTEKRKMAKTNFEKDFFKLLNNAVFGKTMENLRNRVNIELVNSSKRALKVVASPAYRASRIFCEDLVGVERVKSCILMNRPIYVGFAILELSKMLMYNFHYNHIKSQYGEKASLLFTDTDSLAYEIQTPDIYQDMSQHKHLYDFSDYPKDHPLFSEENKKRIGYFKDELNSTPIQEFIGLRPKMYSILSSAGEKKRAKGVSTHVVARKITHSDYRRCLLSVRPTMEEQIRIDSSNHKLFTVCQNKVALSPIDDKRYLHENGVTSYAYGHFKIKEE